MALLTASTTARALGNATTISGRFVEEEDDKKGQRTTCREKGFGSEEVRKRNRREKDEMGREKREEAQREKERKGTVSQRAGTATNHRQFHRGAMQTGDH